MNRRIVDPDVSLSASLASTTLFESESESESCHALNIVGNFEACGASTAFPPCRTAWPPLIFCRAIIQTKASETAGCRAVFALVAASRRYNRGSAVELSPKNCDGPVIAAVGAGQQGQRMPA